MLKIPATLFSLILDLEVQATVNNPDEIEINAPTRQFLLQVLQNALNRSQIDQEAYDLYLNLLKEDHEDTSHESNS